MKNRGFPGYLNVPTIYAAVFFLLGIVLAIIIQITGGKLLFPTTLDRLVYLVYEPLSFSLIGSAVGLFFLMIFKMIEIPLNRFCGTANKTGRLRISMSVFWLILIVGAFLSNNVMIQGGYKFSIPGNVITLCAALVGGYITFSRHHLFRSRNPRRTMRFHVILILISLLYLVSVRFWWVGSERVHGSESKRSESSTSSESQTMKTSLAEIENVIIIILDALRADHLSLYGYDRLTSPNIDKWAQGRGSIVFDNAFTPKTKTSPAVASLFTGLYPSSHRIYYCAQFLRDDLTTLSEILQHNGFRTASIVANANVSEKFNFHQGFSYHKSGFSSKLAPAEELVDESIKWLDSVKGERLFLYLHFLDTHTPYEPPEQYKMLFLQDERSKEFKDWDIPVGSTFLGHIRDEIVIEDHETDIDYYVSMYDSEIRYFDAEIQRLLEYLDENGLSRNTLVIFTSDHGESLTEHDFFFAHGSFAYQTTAKIPLIIHHESFGEARRNDALVSLIDLAPTILDLLNLRVDNVLDGVSLVEILTDPEVHPEYVYILGGDRHEWVILHAITDGRWKLIYNPLGLSRNGLYNLFNSFYPRYKIEWISRSSEFRDPLLEYQLYDLEKDPGETKNVVGEYPAEAQRLKRVLFSLYHRPVGNVHEQDVKLESLDEKTLENLRALGYVR